MWSGDRLGKSGEVWNVGNIQYLYYSGNYMGNKCFHELKPAHYRLSRSNFISSQHLVGMTSHGGLEINNDQSINIPGIGKDCKIRAFFPPDESLV